MIGIRQIKKNTELAERILRKAYSDKTGWPVIGKISDDARKEWQKTGSKVPETSFYYIPFEFRAFVKDFSIFLPELEKVIGKISQFTDFGCGIGIFPYLVEIIWGIKSNGIELSPICVSECEKRNVSVINDDIFNHTEIKSGTLAYTYMPIQDRNIMQKFVEQLENDMENNSAHWEVYPMYGKKEKGQYYWESIPTAVRIKNSAGEIIRYRYFTDFVGMKYYRR